MISQLFNCAQFLLSQTEQEKRLTVVYIGVFLLFLTLLLVDMYAMKKWATNKTINKIILVLLIIAMVAFAVAYFIVSANK